MTLLDRLFRRGRLQDEAADEIAAHLDERIADLIAQGVPAAEARARARRALGNVVQVVEDSRGAWGWPLVDSFVADLRLAARQMRRVPAHTTTIVVTLAIGIAAAATALSWTRSVLIDALPGADGANEVFAIETTTASGSPTAASWLDYRDFRDYLKSFDGIAAAYPTALAMGDETNVERRWGELVSANFFDVLRVRPALGTFFSAPADDAVGGHSAAVISYSLWQARWHGDSSVVGSAVRLNGYPFTIIGVTPPAFRGSMLGQEYQVWVPAAMLGQIVPTGGWWLRDRGTRTFRVLARLAPNVDLARARQEVATLAARMSAANRENKDMGGRVLPLWQSHWGLQNELRAPLMLLLGAAGLILAIICVNTANLLLARSMGRRPELSLRMALGAPRRRLVRQLLTEAALPGAVGTVLGLAAALSLARSLGWLLPSFAPATVAPPTLSFDVVAAVSALALGVMLAAAALPAWMGLRDAPAEAMREGGRGSVSGWRSARLRGALVTAEMALAVTALIGAGTFYRSYRNALAVSPGFDASGVAMASASVTLAGYDSSRAEQFLTDVTGRVARDPGVTAATYTDFPPLGLSGDSWEDLQVEGYAPPPTENMKISRAAVGPDYFKVLHIPLLQGREFVAADDSLHPAVMIVNETFAQRYLAGRPVLGVRVHGWGRWFTIVGVARDVKTRRVTDGATPYFYVPVRQVFRPEYGYTFLARTTRDPGSVAADIARAVKAVDATVPVYATMPLAEYAAGPLRTQQVAAQLLEVLSAVSLLLAAVGLYGMVAFLVARQTREFAIRVALGAQRVDVARVVAAQAGPMLVAGIAIGVAGGIALARTMRAVLFGVSPADVAVLGAAVLGMAIVAFIATVIPARRAVRVDPIAALRND